MAPRLALATLCVTCAAGCTSIRITADAATLRAAEAASGTELRQVALAVDVGDSNQRERERFTDAVRRTGLFKSVAVLTERSLADVVLFDLRHEFPPIGSGFQCFEPYLLVATVGLVPAVCEGTHTLSFRLRATKREAGIAVREVFLQKSVWGWAAVALNASPRWQHEGAFEQFLGHVFLARREDILKLVSSNTALLTDTYASPLRARHGAAERER